MTEKCKFEISVTFRKKGNDKIKPHNSALQTTVKNIEIIAAKRDEENYSKK
jgi:hypothetical protein